MYGAAFLMLKRLASALEASRMLTDRLEAARLGGARGPWRAPGLREIVRRFERVIVIAAGLAAAWFSLAVYAALIPALVLATPHFLACRKVILGPKGRHSSQARALEIWNTGQTGAALLVHAGLAWFIGAMVRPVL